MRKIKFKIFCAMIAVVVLFIPSFSVVANDAKVKINTNHYAINTIYDGIDQHFFNYYNDIYGVHLIKIEIDGEIYYVNEDIEITDDFIDSIRQTKLNGTFSVCVSDDMHNSANRDTCNHRYNQRTVILGIPSACWESQMYCINGGGCSYYYIAYIERAHRLTVWNGKYYVCSVCGSSGP
jgi:hypothetical protein